ncbi:hypothetical protein D3C73_1451660 [compost metagenome]
MRSKPNWQLPQIFLRANELIKLIVEGDINDTAKLVVKVAINQLYISFNWATLHYINSFVLTWS